MTDFLNYLLAMHPVELGLRLLFFMAIFSLISMFLKWPMKILKYVLGALVLMYVCSLFS